MTGDDVSAAQQALIKAGYGPGSADSVFGHKTEAAVKKYQAKTGFVADGIANRETWDKLIG